MLVPPDQVQVRLDVGWLPGVRAGMWAAEAFIPHTKELLAMEVHPTRRFDSLEHFLEVTTTYHRTVLRDLFDPDPF